ncbi:hypothetical protein H4R33_003749 [Dimargaris cristalligena]|nr:hypothetical protein H4R33_003749 [Dimargaris cristalligena]
MSTQSQTLATAPPLQPPPSFKSKASGFFSRLARQPSSPQLNTSASRPPYPPSAVPHSRSAAPSLPPVGSHSRTTPSTPSNITTFQSQLSPPPWDPTLLNLPSVSAHHDSKSTKTPGCLPSFLPNPAPPNGTKFDPLISPTFFEKLQRLNISRSHIDRHSPLSSPIESVSSDLITTFTPGTSVPSASHNTGSVSVFSLPTATRPSTTSQFPPSTAQPSLDMPFDPSRPQLPHSAAKFSPKGATTDKPPAPPDSSPIIPARRPKKMSSFWRFFNKSETPADSKLTGSPTLSVTSSSTSGVKHTRSQSGHLPSSTHSSPVKLQSRSHHNSPAGPAPRMLPSMSTPAASQTTVALVQTPSVTRSSSTRPSDTVTEGDDVDFQSAREYPSQRESLTGTSGTPSEPPGEEVTSSIPYLETRPVPSPVAVSRPTTDNDHVALADLVKDSSNSPFQKDKPLPPTPTEEKALEPALESSHPAPVLKKSVSSPSTSEAVSGGLVPLDSPDAQAQEIAACLFHNDDPTISPEEYVEYLGKRGPLFVRIRAHYFNHFDFHGASLEEAFRSLCAHLFVRGESQVIDRILIDFSRRYWNCNPRHPLLTDEDIVYAIVFSLLLLNTDLHVSQSDEKLSKQKFIELTLTTIDTCRQITARKREQHVQPSAPNPGILTSPILSPMMKDLNASQPVIPERTTSDMAGSSRSRLGIAPNTASSGKRFSFFDAAGIGLGANTFGSRNNERSALSSNASISSKDPSPNTALITLLKELYASIKHQKLAQPSEALLLSRASLSSFRSGSNGPAPNGGTNLTRSRSVSGLGPNQMLMGQSQRSNRYLGPRRGLLGLAAVAEATGADRPPGVHQTSPIAAVLTASASTLPFDGESRPSLNASSPRLISLRFNPASPGRSRAASVSSLSPSKKMNPFSASVVMSEEDDFGYQDQYAQSLNASILMTGHYSNDYPETPIPNHMGYDDRFVKSCVLVRKHLMERSDRKATNRSWKQCFVILEHGMLNMYKTEKGQAYGCELTDPALQLGHVSLRHSLTNALPSPGYSRVRPFVFAIQLPHGGVYLFQAGTREQLEEWVQCCNYWAARESKEPLIGGVCNIDYGWVDNGDDSASERSVAVSVTGPSETPLANLTNQNPIVAPLNYHSAESSVSLAVDSASDIKSSSKSNDNLSVIYDQSENDLSVLSQSPANPTGIPVLPNSIYEWKPPAQSLIRSNLDENAQLRALLKQISHLENQLSRHQDLRSSIDRRYVGRTPVYNKAFSNWERKSQYLLRELIKYQTYADCLKSAISTRPATSAASGGEASNSGTLSGNNNSTATSRTGSVHAQKRTLSRPPSFHQLGDQTPGTTRSIAEDLPLAHSIPVRTSSARLKTQASVVDLAKSFPTPVTTPAVIHSNHASNTSLKDRAIASATPIAPLPAPAPAPTPEAVSAPLAGSGPENPDANEPPAPLQT